MKLFDKLMILLLLIGVAACAPRSSNPLTPKNQKGYPLRVVGTGVFNGYNDPKFIPWARIDDPIDGKHVFVLISDDNRVCVVPPSLWAIAPIGVPVTCEWRIPRSGHRLPPVYRTKE